MLKLFNHVFNKLVDVVVVTYMDRLAWFGFRYLEYFFKQYGVNIETVFGEGPKMLPRACRGFDSDSSIVRWELR